MCTVCLKESWRGVGGEGAAPPPHGFCPEIQRACLQSASRLLKLVEVLARFCLGLISLLFRFGLGSVRDVFRVVLACV